MKVKVEFYRKFVRQVLYVRKTLHKISCIRDIFEIKKSVDYCGISIVLKCVFYNCSVICIIENKIHVRQSFV